MCLERKCNVSASAYHKHPKVLNEVRVCILVSPNPQGLRVNYYETHYCYSLVLELSVIILWNTPLVCLLFCNSLYLSTFSNDCHMGGSLKAF